MTNIHVDDSGTLKPESGTWFPYSLLLLSFRLYQTSSYLFIKRELKITPKFSLVHEILNVNLLEEQFFKPVYLKALRAKVLFGV